MTDNNYNRKDVHHETNRDWLRRICGLKTRKGEPAFKTDEDVRQVGEYLRKAEETFKDYARAASKSWAKARDIVLD